MRLSRTPLDAHKEDGIALVAAMLTVMLLSALGLSLVLLAMTDTMAAGAMREGRMAAYAAEAGLDRALTDLRRLPDWDDVLLRGASSGFTDGPPTGVRPLPGGGTVSLESVLNRANCGSEQACTDAAIALVSGERPWGPNNPRWRLFAWGRAATLLSANGSDSAGDASPYLVVMVADDPAETDGTPERDGAPGSPGSGVILVRAEAFGAGGAHRALEATVSRARPEEGRRGYESQQGQSRTSTGASGSIQVPGGPLTHREWGDTTRSERQP